MKQINKIKFFKSINYNPHKSQNWVHDSNARFKIVVAGRRFGKSILASRECMAHLITPNQKIWIVAPTYDLTKKVFREVFWGFHKYLPHWLKKTSESDLRIELVNGSILECKSADNPISLIGEGIDFLIIDECAKVHENVWNEALRPTLTDTEGKALLISTPNGMNWFYNLFLRGQDNTEKNYDSWQFLTKDNPNISRDEIEEAKKTIPERVFKQEYLAEFIQDSGSVFRNIDNCIKGKYETPKEDKSYIIGVDLAKYNDFTVLLVGEIKDNRLKVVYMDRFNKIDWSFQKKRILALSRKYNNAQVIIDSTGLGDSIYEDLSKENLRISPFKIKSNTIKNQLIENLAIALENEQISFPNIPELINELKSFSYERSERTGRTIYNAPSGYHDDCVIALALAWKHSNYQPLYTNIGLRKDKKKFNEETWGEKIDRLRKKKSYIFK